VESNLQEEQIRAGPCKTTNEAVAQRLNSCLIRPMTFGTCRLVPSRVTLSAAAGYLLSISHSRHFFDTSLSSSHDSYLSFSESDFIVRCGIDDIFLPSFILLLLLLLFLFFIFNMSLIVVFSLLPIAVVFIQQRHGRQFGVDVQRSVPVARRQRQFISGCGGSNGS